MPKILAPVGSRFCHAEQMIYELDKGLVGDALKSFLALMLVVEAVSAESTHQATEQLVRSTRASATGDIGAVTGLVGDLKNMVLYEREGQVYRKFCKLTVIEPLTGNCESDQMPLSMGYQSYLDKLPYDTGPYLRTPDGLRRLKAIIAANLTSPNIARLRDFERHLEMILEIGNNLKAHRNITCYEEACTKLLAPFVAEERRLQAEREENERRRRDLERRFAEERQRRDEALERKSDCRQRCAETQDSCIRRCRGSGSFYSHVDCVGACHRQWRSCFDECQTIQ